jgi:hypothetical protein
VSARPRAGDGPCSSLRASPLPNHLCPTAPPEAPTTDNSAEPAGTALPGAGTVLDCRPLCSSYYAAPTDCSTRGGQRTTAHTHNSQLSLSSQPSIVQPKVHSWRGLCTANQPRVRCVPGRAAHRCTLCSVGAAVLQPASGPGFPCATRVCRSRAKPEVVRKSTTDGDASAYDQMLDASMP